jgi:hypothetical protein
MKLYKHLKLAAGVLSVAIASSTSAFAIPTLMLSSDGGANWTTAVGSADGALSYSGFVGSWSVSVNGSTILSPAEVDLLDVTARTRNAGSLTLRFFETDLTVDSVLGFFKNLTAGVVANYGSLTLNTYIDPANNGFSTMPGTAVQLTSQTLFGGFDQTVNSSYAPLPAEAFSLMVEATIRLRGAGGTTTFSQSLVDPLPEVNPVIDGGSTLSLLGAALVGFSCFARSRKSTA